MFGFVGAGATLGQLFGSVFAAATAWMGPCRHHASFTVKVSSERYFSSAFVVSLNAILISLRKVYLISMADLLLFAALLMEFAAQSSKGITKDTSPSSEELSPLRLAKPRFAMFS